MKLQSPFRQVVEVFWGFRCVSIGRHADQQMSTNLSCMATVWLSSWGTSSRPAVISCWVWGLRLYRGCIWAFILSKYHPEELSFPWLAGDESCVYTISTHSLKSCFLCPKIRFEKNFFPPCDLWIEWNRDLNSSLKVSHLPLLSSESKVITHYRFLLPPLEAWLHCKLHRDGFLVFMELCAVTHWPSVQYEPEARAKHNKLLNYYLKYFDFLGYFFPFSSN